MHKNRVLKTPSSSPPCSSNCPAGIDIPRYIRLVGEGNLQDAVAVIREKNPFPAVCGYICPHPCETVCRAGEKLGQPIAIRALHRFAAEHGDPPEIFPAAAPVGKRVAVVGAGPAGLTAGFFLSRLGHQVTVYESEKRPGGWLQTAVPEYRLPKRVLDREIAFIEKTGVSIETESHIDSIDALFDSGFEAVFLATGSRKPHTLRIAGENTPGVVECIDLLEGIKRGEDIRLGERVAVVGGGNAAIDAARSAARMGAKETTILYRRSREEMPAIFEEIEQALAEGIHFEFLTAPTKIASRDCLEIECIRMELGSPDATGRCRPVPLAGSEFVKRCDTVVIAIGQGVDEAGMLGMPYDPARGYSVIEETLETPRKGVFAGGDAVHGPATAIRAIADGRKAADRIDRYLGGRGLTESTGEALPEALSCPQKFCVGTRNEGEKRPVEERTATFAAVELGLASPEEAARESARCLRCDLPIRIEADMCVGCLTCSLLCSFVHEGRFNPAAAHVEVKQFYESPNEIIFSARCDDCGVCALYCPYGTLRREPLGKGAE